MLVQNLEPDITLLLSQKNYFFYFIQKDIFFISYKANTQRKRVLGEIATNDIIGDWSKFLMDFSARGANITGKIFFNNLIIYSKY